MPMDGFRVFGGGGDGSDKDPIRKSLCFFFFFFLGRAFGKGGSASMRMFFFPWFGPGWIGMIISVRLLT